MNFIVGCALFRYSISCFSSDGGPGQMHSMSSMYLNHSNGFVGYSFRSFSSRSAINRLAYEGGHFCTHCCALYLVVSFVGKLEVVVF